MESVLSYIEFISKISDAEKSFLLLYREGSEQSSCAFRNVTKAAGETEKAKFFSADVNVVRDIHKLYGVESVPSLLVFADGRLTNIIKGCHESSYYKALTHNNLCRSEEATGKKSAKNVTVYSTPACSWCNTLKAWLRKNNIQFTDVDVSRDQNAAEALVRRSGQQGVPQTDINGQIVVGFNQSRLKELLEMQ
ncbi:MAG TPA: thioredoxin family protein [Bacteroidales bacterium]|nr:thioredoxin family protein [Bacteroidales bacterium]